MIGKEIIGRESEPVAVKIQSEQVRRFAEAAGIPFSEQIPPTYVGTLRQAAIEGVDLLAAGTIHGEEKITYHRQIKLGESIPYMRRVKDVYERTGKSGKMTFVILETVGFDLTGELVFTINSVLISPPKEGTQ